MAGSIWHQLDGELRPAEVVNFKKMMEVYSRNVESHTQVDFICININH